MNAYDLTAGCPGWVKALINADNDIKVGRANAVLVIGAELISPHLDPHDRDRMIFGDGAGAVIIKTVESDEPGIISSSYTQ